MDKRYHLRDARGYCGTITAASPEAAIEISRQQITDGRPLTAVLDPHCEAAKFSDVVELLSAYARLCGQSDRDVWSWVSAGWDQDTSPDDWIDSWNESRNQE